jgi:hypothetical protein
LEKSLKKISNLKQDDKRVFAGKEYVHVTDDAEPGWRLKIFFLEVLGNIFKCRNKAIGRPPNTFMRISKTS